MTVTRSSEALERFLQTAELDGADLALESLKRYLHTARDLLASGNLRTPRQECTGLIGKEFDFLMEGGNQYKNLFELVKEINMHLPRGRGSCVVTSIRNEAPYIVEWVAHYRALGFDTVIVYANDSDDGSNEILDYLHKIGEIVFIRNECKPTVSPQLKSFRHAAHFNPLVRAHEWVLFCDLDEFLILKAPLKDITVSKYDAISFNWNLFISRNDVEFIDDLVLERFKLAKNNEQYKTLSRVSRIKDVRSAHYPELIEGSVWVNANLRSPKFRERLNEIAYSDGVGSINHYSLKSFAEFAALKKARGRGTRGIGGERRSYSFFFRGNDGGTIRNVPESDLNRTRAYVSKMLDNEKLFNLQKLAVELAVARIKEIDQSYGLYYLHEQFKAIDDLKGVRKWAEAEILLKGVARRIPNDPSMILELARLAERGDDLSVALSRLNRVKRDFPNELPRDIETRIASVKRKMGAT